MKTCKTCKKEFEIPERDKDFYKKIKVQEPNYCPDCRVMRRLAFRNERTLYRNTCELCKESIVSIYPTGTPFPVYCHKCWWSDKWDPLVYAQDYDKSRPFLQQFGELKNKVPRISLLVIDSVNCDYTNNAGENKNCYLIFAAENNEDSSYSRLIMKCNNVMDCVATYESELCYECIDCKNCFKCLYSERLQECADVLFSFDMRNSQNCIFCTNGRNLNYQIFNKKVTKEEYEKVKAEIFSSYQSIEEAKEKYKKLRGEAIVKYALETKCQNATGDYMYNCYDGTRLFDVRNSKDSSYIADAEDPTDCQDCNNVYFKPELCYNMMGTLATNKCICGVYIMWGNEVDYSDSCYHCSSCFGSVGLNKKSYHILNKEYTKDEYLKLKEEIVDSMKADGSYGDFLSPELSPFGYNETLAKEYYPLSRDEALARGYKWQENATGIFGKETISEANMPESIEQVEASIVNEILECNECGKNFKITENELEFYQRLHLPLPHKDFECRHKDRMNRRNPRALWPRKCMNENCNNEFETSYSPEREEKIFCTDCYNREVL